MKLIGRVLFAFIVTFAITALVYLYFGGSNLMDRIVQTLAFLAGIYLWHLYIFGKKEAK